MPRRRFLQEAVGATTGASALAVLFPFRTLGSGTAAEGGGFHPEVGGRFKDLRKEYDLDPGVTYLNHASIGTIPRSVRQALQAYQKVCESNPWLYIWGEAWDEAVAETREKAAALLGCRSSEVVLTRSTTEGFNILAHGLHLKPDDEFLFSSLNHVGASECWFHQAGRGGFTVRRFDFPVSDAPHLTGGDLVEIHAREIKDKTRVLIFPHVDNLVGLRHPVAALAARARAMGVEFVAVDAAQSGGMLPLDLSGMGVDFLATSCHKWLQAPKGTGFLYVRQGVQAKLDPLMVTWGQKLWEGTVRIYEDFGTRDLATLLALGDALDYQRRLGEGRKVSHERELWRRCKERTRAISGLSWCSPGTWSMAASLYCVGLAAAPADQIFREMFRRHGFVFRPFKTQGLNSLRLSPHPLNSLQEIDRFFDHLEPLVV
ncbi:MAG: aminotransferase class V-fold PLP-dependent enzyme [Acidobacteriota bacterium]